MSPMFNVDILDKGDSAKFDRGVNGQISMTWRASFLFVCPEIQERNVVRISPQGVF